VDLRRHDTQIHLIVGDHAGEPFRDIAQFDSRSVWHLGPVREEGSEASASDPSTPFDQLYDSGVVGTTISPEMIFAL